MLRRLSKFKPDKKSVNCIFMNGGVGDHVGSLIAANYIIKNYPWINLLIWTPDFLLDFAKNVLPLNAIVRSYSQMKEKYDRFKPTKTTEWDGTFSPMKIHTVDYAFLKLCDENPSIEHKNYLKVDFTKVDISKVDLPNNYVVLATGFTAPVREFNVEAINRLIDYIIDMGYTPVFLGQRQTATGAKHIITGTFKNDINYSKGIDLIDKTTLLQAAKVIQGAKAIAGVDCGLLHIAGCTDTPIIGGFTTVNPELRAPIRNNILGWNFYPVVPDNSLDCKFCQVSTNFLYDHDYKFCIYKDYECVKQLTSEKFIEQLRKVL